MVNEYVISYMDRERAALEKAYPTLSLIHIYEQMARLIERQGELYEQIDQVNGWELDSVLERAMDALRCPDPRCV